MRMILWEMHPSGSGNWREHSAFSIFSRKIRQRALRFVGEFEAQESPEAKFAHTLDKCQPVLLNDASGGRSWREHGVFAGQILERNARTPEGSEKIWEYEKDIMRKMLKKETL